MNNSGESVAALAKFYRVPTTRVLVISDDLDQPVAQVSHACSHVLTHPAVRRSGWRMQHNQQNQYQQYADRQQDLWFCLCCDFLDMWRRRSL